MLPDFTHAQWMLTLLAAFGIGLSKSGLLGIGLMHVLIFAGLFSARGSTGVVLPMLIAADIAAVLLFRRHALWSHVARTLPPAVLGVAIGWWLMRWLPDARYPPLIGLVVLVLALLQLLRSWKPALFAEIPHSRGFAWAMGLSAGVTTMLANAAGPVMGVYLLAVSLPKAEFVGTSAWFFLIINLIKVPFSLQLGLITTQTLLFNLLLLPLVLAGLFAGRSLIHRLPQKWFDSLILGFAILASMRLLGAF